MLINHQTILFQIAEIRIEIDVARLLTLKTALIIDLHGNKFARKEISMIKIVAPKMAQKVCDLAI